MAERRTCEATSDRRPRLLYAAADGAELVMTVPPRGPRPIAEALRPRRATTFPLARVSVFSSGAASSRSWLG